MGHGCARAASSFAPREVAAAGAVGPAGHATPSPKPPTNRAPFRGCAAGACRTGASACCERGACGGSTAGCCSSGAGCAGDMGVASSGMEEMCATGAAATPLELLLPEGPLVLGSGADCAVGCEVGTMPARPPPRVSPPRSIISNDSCLTATKSVRGCRGARQRQQQGWGVPAWRRLLGAAQSEAGPGTAARRPAGCSCPRGSAAQRPRPRSPARSHLELQRGGVWAGEEGQGVQLCAGDGLLPLHVAQHVLELLVCEGVVEGCVPCGTIACCCGSGAAQHQRFGLAWPLHSKPGPGVAPGPGCAR